METVYVTPRTILKSVDEIMQATSVADAIGHGDAREQETVAAAPAEGPERLIARLEGEMLEAAKALEFERAASLRDRIDEIRETLAVAAGDAPPGRAGRKREAAASTRRRHPHAPPIGVP